MKRNTDNFHFQGVRVVKDPKYRHDLTMNVPINEVVVGVQDKQAMSELLLEDAGVKTLWVTNQRTRETEFLRKHVITPEPVRGHWA